MRSRVAAHVIVACVVAASFAGGLSHPLLATWDDGRFILDNPLVEAATWESFVAIVSAPRFEAYHPLHLLSYWLDVPWAGPSPVVLHATSLLLWLAAASCVLALMRRLGLGVIAAGCATLAVMVHPAQVEVVSWATGRKDVLAMLFCAAAWLAHLRSQRAFDRAGLGALGLYALAVLSKTTSLPLPLVLALGDVALGRRTPRAAAIQQLPAFALAAIASAGVLVIWRANTMIREQAADLSGTPARVIATLSHQLRTALWPSSVSPLYPTVALQVSALDVAVVLAFVLLTAWLVRKRTGLAALGMLAFVAFMLPVSNAVPMYFPLQDRYLSLPLLGLGLTLGAGVDAIAQRAGVRTAWWLAAAIVLGLSARTQQYLGNWQSEPQLWGHAVSAQPRAYYAWMKLGEVRRKAGDFEGAASAYQQLIVLEPRRKVGYAALFQSLLLLDALEQRLDATAAESLSRRYYDALDDAGSLAALGAKLRAAGYVRAAALAEERVKVLTPR